MKYVILEHHPNDSRLKIAHDGICQTLSQRMGTGGNNVPLILVILDEDENSTCGERPGRWSDSLDRRRDSTNTAVADEAP